MRASLTDTLFDVREPPLYRQLMCPLEWSRARLDRRLAAAASQSPGRRTDDRHLVEIEDAERAAALAHLRHLATQGPLTLLTATKQVEISQAAVLADAIRTSSSG